HSRKLSTSSTKWSGWLDSNQRPPASEAGTLAGLSYTLLALRREIESLSPVRQAGRLTRCVTEQRRIWCVPSSPLWASTGLPAEPQSASKTRVNALARGGGWCVWADSNGH